GNLDPVPFAFFGHSTGAIIAFEVARWLRRNGRPGPTRLFAAGNCPPHIPEKYEPIHHLPEAEFIEALSRLDGTPAEVLANPRLMQLLSPMLRADMALL